jgi:hypothetical protein
MMRGLLWLVTAAAVTAGSFLLYGAGQALFDPHPNLQWLNIYGDYMDNYDMDYMNPDALDWPVGIIWRDDATLDDVRSYLSQNGYGPIEGANEFVRVWEDSEGGVVEWSGSSGNQTACFDGPDPEAPEGFQGCQSGDRCMKHTRTYADNDYFSNDEWGHYIIATAHYDTNHADCVGSGNEKYGWSETVEQIILDQAAADGFDVISDYQPMYNEGYGDIDATHYHQSDGYASFINFFPDADGDGVPDAIDNCPYVSNPDQANYDRRRDNGPNIPNQYTSNPASDWLGDACDTDKDNDRLPDSSEYGLYGCPNITVADSDADRAQDGWEVYTSYDPCSASSAPSWSGGGDSDGDHLLNGSERRGYTTCISSGDTYPGWTGCAEPMDSDGDGCSDMVEALDFNGDRRVNSTDVGLMNKRFAGKIDPDPVSDAIFDVNKDGGITSADTGTMNKYNCLTRYGEDQIGCPECPPE